ncbi:MAG TPA: transglycosylase SLT domain-containing protein [Verrucomicrobiae bacterium]|jgi:hypothetical protein|nr:transglycosylase SLT domain-containing protein [Verrucomicrobiae bacterium]
MAATANGALSTFRHGRGARWRARCTVVSYCVLALGVFFIVNWLYQVYRKPAEMLAPVGDSFVKNPEATWKSYGASFEKYSTADLPAEFLAALAQVEADGNPLAHTYWRWRWSWNPFEIYRPASTAVGMFQITDGTFAEARNYCIHDHKVASGGACRLTSLYNRALPSHAIELTAAYLQENVQKALAGKHGIKTNPGQRQKLAAAIHLCGPGKADAFIGRGFRPAKNDKCGEQNLRHYLKRVDQAKQRFVKLKAKQA